MTEAERIESQLERLKSTAEFPLFATFIREGRVRAWLRSNLSISDEDFSAALMDLDYRQAELLPETIDDIAPRTQKKLRAIFEFVKVQLRKKPTKHLAYAIMRSEVPPSPSEMPTTLRLEGVDDWKLPLPIPPACEKLTKISPTRLDSYLRCPFTYFLKRKDIFGDKRMDGRVSELAAWECGNFVHEALEAWGLSELRDSEDADAIWDFLLEKVDAQVADRFGERVPSLVLPQLEVVRTRLGNFARLQSQRRREGWRIVAVERKLEIRYPDSALVYGKCDRIDYHEATGKWCVVDYKSWDSLDRAKCFDEATQSWLSLQLPLYCAMLAADASEDFAAINFENVIACYCVLGRTEATTAFTGFVNGSLAPKAECKAKELISRIERGIFWPPSPNGDWQRDYADWLSPSPEVAICSAWLDDQKHR